MNKPLKYLIYSSLFLIALFSLFKILNFGRNIIYQSFQNIEKRIIEKH